MGGASRRTREFVVSGSLGRMMQLIRPFRLPACTMAHRLLQERNVSTRRITSRRCGSCYTNAGCRIEFDGESWEVVRGLCRLVVAEGSHSQCLEAVQLQDSKTTGEETGAWHTLCAHLHPRLLLPRDVPFQSLALLPFSHSPSSQQRPPNRSAAAPSSSSFAIVTLLDAPGCCGMIQWQVTKERWRERVGSRSTLDEEFQ